MQSGCHSSNDARLAPSLAVLPQPKQSGPGSAGQEQGRHAPRPVLVARRDRDVQGGIWRIRRIFDTLQELLKTRFCFYWRQFGFSNTNVYLYYRLARKIEQLRFKKLAWKEQQRNGGRFIHDNPADSSSKEQVVL